jgi:predicted  nucleic acid-binding Zn-ribbon protein
MSYHISYNHDCPNCGAFYIPFDQAVPCPKCGQVESERFDFIPEAARSARINFMEDGHYVPAAWYVGSLGDHVLSLVFDVLDQHRKDTSGREFSAVAAEALARMDWGEQLYLRDHTHAIACRVREQLDRGALNSSEPDSA